MFCPVPRSPLRRSTDFFLALLGDSNSYQNFRFEISDSFENGIFQDNSSDNVVPCSKGKYQYLNYNDICGTNKH